MIDLGANVSDVDGDELAINLATLPVDGALYQYAGDDLSGDPILGQPIISIGTQILGGKLVLVPDANLNTTSNGGNYDFDYQVIDPAQVGGLTDTATVSVTVTAIDDDPVVSGPADLTVDEDTDSQSMSFSVSDLDVNDPGGDGEISVTVSANDGTVTIDGQTGASVTLSGLTLAQVQAALADVVYKGDQDYNGDDTVTVTVDDGGNVGETRGPGQRQRHHLHGAGHGDPGQRRADCERRHGSRRPGRGRRRGERHRRFT